MDYIAEDEGFAPAITWLNLSGDVTLTWTPENQAHIQELVRRKMAEGYSFFILQPRLLSFLGDKKVPLTDPAQLDACSAVVVPDSVVSALVSSLGDAELEKTIQAGKARLAKTPKAPKATVRRAKSPEEVVRRQSVAVRPVVGG